MVIQHVKGNSLRAFVHNPTLSTDLSSCMVALACMVSWAEILVRAPSVVKLRMNSLPIFNVLLLFYVVEVSVLEPYFAESFCFKLPIVGTAAQYAVAFEVLDGFRIVGVAVDSCFVDVVVCDLFLSCSFSCS